MERSEQRRILLDLYESAVAAAQPAHCLKRHFPAMPAAGRLIVLACGKAAPAMAEAAEAHYAEAIKDGRFEGLAVTRRGYGRPLKAFTLLEASHPVPDESSAAAAERALALASDAREDDLVLALISGGASALWLAPAPGISLADKQALTRSLLKAGAPIGAMNCVRKHLSRIKGGRLARAAAPARLVTLAISDVPGDAPDQIGSGPTVPDSTTLADARNIIERYHIDPPISIITALNDANNETPKLNDPAFTNNSYILATSPKDALAVAHNKAAILGYKVILLGDDLEGEARDVAREHAALALEAKRRGEKTAIISGGELTVTITGDGRGGPNQEYALALALALNGAENIYALAGDTDGSDGGTGQPDDPAGAIVMPDCLMRARGIGMIPEQYLAKNDSTTFFEMLDDLLICGPTSTNVNDFRVILVDPA